VDFSWICVDFRGFFVDLRRFSFVDFRGFSWIFVDLGRSSISGGFGFRSGSKTALSGVVNPELQFQFQEKDKKVKKHGKIKGLRQKNKI
jgi:hypothetical protein